MGLRRRHSSGGCESNQPGAKANWRKVFAAGRFLSLANVTARAAPYQLLVKNQYQVGKKIANGAFGQLRLGRDLHFKKGNSNSGSHDGRGGSVRRKRSSLVPSSDGGNGSPAGSLKGGGNGAAAVDDLVAIKLEPANTRIPMLGLEFRFYKLIGPLRGFPKVLHYGPCGKYNALVMELLGPNLEELFAACGKRFSLQTILLIAIQMLNRLEHLHSRGLIYRDVKPENCCIGRSSLNRANIVHLVDLGLAKEYVDPDTGEHIPYCEDRSLTGTVRYMSLNAHQGKEQSRRDDLEALGHMFFYFLSNGRLPWQGVKCDDLRRRYHIIGGIKEETKISQLGNAHPWEFSLYLRYCRSLRFAQTPDYSYLRNLFRSCLQQICDVDENLRFDWELPDPDRRHAGLARMSSRGNINVSNNFLALQQQLQLVQQQQQQSEQRQQQQGRPSQRRLLSTAVLDDNFVVTCTKSNESVILSNTSKEDSGGSAVTRLEKSPIEMPEGGQLPNIPEGEVGDAGRPVLPPVVVRTSDVSTPPLQTSGTNRGLKVPATEEVLLSPEWRRRQAARYDDVAVGHKGSPAAQPDRPQQARRVGVGADERRVEVVDFGGCCAAIRRRRMSMRW